MRSTRVVHTVSAHAEGEVGDVIVGGVAPPPGETIWDQARWIARDETLRNFMLNEPRGGVFRHVNLLVPPKDPRADAAWIIMEPADTPPMSGSNAICVATVLAETGLVETRAPETVLTLEAPGGLVTARVTMREGRAEQVTITNLPSFADRLSAMVEIEGHGAIAVDTAFGGDTFAIVDAAELGFALSRDEARDLAALGPKITEAVNQQIGFTHPTNPEINAVSFCQFAGAIADGPDGPGWCNAVAIRPGKIDRSPTGTGCSARLAVLHARGEARPGDRFTVRSLIGSRFQCWIEGVAELSGRPAILPSLSGRAWITGTHQHMLDPTDPYPTGYRLSDTWPGD